MSTDTVIVEVTVTGETDKALFVKDDNGQEHCLPKSQIEILDEFWGVDDAVTIEIPTWLAEEKGVEG